MRNIGLACVVLGLSLFELNAVAQDSTTAPVWFDSQIQPVGYGSAGYTGDIRDDAMCRGIGCTETSDFDSILSRLDALEHRDEVFTSRCGWYATVGVRYVEPRSVQLPVHVTGAVTQGLYDFDPRPSPFAQLEWVRDDGLGLRGSFWYAEHNERAIPESVGNAPFGLTITAQVADLEITQDVDFEFAQLVFGGGARYLAYRT